MQLWSTVLVTRLCWRGVGWNSLRLTLDDFIRQGELPTNLLHKWLTLISSMNISYGRPSRNCCFKATVIQYDKRSGCDFKYCIALPPFDWYNNVLYCNNIGTLWKIFTHSFPCSFQRLFVSLVFNIHAPTFNNDGER